MNPVFVEVERNTSIVMANSKLLKLSICCATAFLVSSDTFAQTEPQGEVKVEADSMLDILVKNRVANRPEKITGYRLLLYTGSRTEAQKVIQDFRAMFPDQPVMLKWDEPNFKVVGGLFYTRADAKAFREECSKKFPMLVIVNDLVDLPPVDDRKKEKGNE